MQQVTELVLIRHGEPELAGTLLGATDVPLTSRGRAQLDATFSALPPPDVLVTSPLRRCAEFAHDWAARLPAGGRFVGVETVNGFREVNFGAWDGLRADQIAAHAQDMLTAYYRDPSSVTPPGGESLSDFSRRVEQALLELLPRYAGKRIYGLCHAGIIRTLIAWCLNIPYDQCTHLYRLAVDYASVTRITLHSHHSTWLPVLTLMNAQPNETPFHPEEAGIRHGSE